MKSNVKSLEVCVYNKRCYVIGYEVDIMDYLEDDIMRQLATPPTSKYLQPLQMFLLLNKVKDQYYGPENFYHNMIWYDYGEGVQYPNLAIDNILCLQYNIPTSIINIDDMADEDSKQAWITYLNQLQEAAASEYGYTYSNKLNRGDYVYSVSVKYESLPLYIKPSTSPTVKGWGSEAAEQLEIREERERQEEERRKEETKLVPPPFEYDINAPRLVIPRNLNSINFPLVKHLLQAIQTTYGVCFDINMIREFHTLTDKRSEELKAKLCKQYGTSKISFNVKKPTPEHYGYQICKALDLDVNRYINRGTGYMSFKKETLEDLVLTYRAKLEREECTQEQYQLLLDNQEAYGYNTDLKLMNELIQGFGDTTGKVVKDEATGRITYHCDISESETKRFTTKNINVQGKPAKIKEMIRTRADNRTVVAIDIKGQEVAILVFGILRNKELQRLSIEYGDCYHAFADVIGIEYTPVSKAIIKVPILSIMNGKSEQTIRGEMYKHLDIMEKIFHVIFDDEGYKEIYNKAVLESKKSKATRRGLFGTEVVANKVGKYGDNAGTRKRQSLNGNFQLTASELVATCLHCMVFDLLTERNKYHLSLEQVTLITTVYDEVLFDVDNEVLDEAKELIQFYLLPTVQGWAELTGEMTEGEYYVHK